MDEAMIVEVKRHYKNRVVRWRKTGYFMELHDDERCIQRRGKQEILEARKKFK